MLPAGCQISTSMLSQKQAPGHLCCMAGQPLEQPPGGRSGLPQASAGSLPGACPGWPCRGPGSLSLWSQTTQSLPSQVSLGYCKQRQQKLTPSGNIGCIDASTCNVCNLYTESAASQCFNEQYSQDEGGEKETSSHQRS